MRRSAGPRLVGATDPLGPKATLSPSSAGAPAARSARPCRARCARGRTPYVIITTCPSTDARWGQTKRPRWGQCKRPLRITPTEIRPKTDGSQATTTSYSYDADGNQTQRTDAQGTTSFEYSPRNELTSEDPPTANAQSYAYDKVGNLTSYTDSGGQVLYFYDDVNLLERLVEPPATEGEPESARTTSFTYNAHNGREQTHYPGGVTQMVDFDDSDPARDSDDSTRIEQVRTTNAAGEDLVNLEWSYRDSNGQDRQLRQTMEDHRRHVRTTYDYDHLNRLTMADTNGCDDQGACEQDRERFTYSFDANSNRLEAEDSVGAPKTSYAYNETNALC